jgi:hypothetical protein
MHLLLQLLGLYHGGCMHLRQVDAAKAVVQLMYEGVVPTSLGAADLFKVSTGSQRCLGTG